MKETFGHDEDAVRQRQRQRGLGQAVVPHPGNQPEQRPAGQQPEQAAADERQEELAQPRTNIGLTPAHDHAEQDGKQHDRRRIVEQSLAFGQADQTRRRPDIAKDGDHRGGVGGGNDGAEQQAGDERDTGEGPQGKADHCRRDQSGDDGEQQDGRCILHHAPHVGGEAGLEHQERQEDVDVGGRADRQVDENVGEVGDLARPAELGQDGRRSAQCDPNHPQKDGWGHFQSRGERLADPDDNQQQSGDQQDEGGLEHRRQKRPDRKAGMGCCASSAPYRALTRGHHRNRTATRRKTLRRERRFALEQRPWLTL